MSIEEVIQFHKQCAKNAPSNILRQAHNSVIATLELHKDISQVDYLTIIRNVQKTINQSISHSFLTENKKITHIKIIKSGIKKNTAKTIMKYLKPYEQKIDIGGIMIVLNSCVSPSLSLEFCDITQKEISNLYDELVNKCYCKCEKIYE